MKQVDYVVICETTVTELAVEVVKYMALGWQCQGGVGTQGYALLQAMVRVEERPK